MHISVDVFSKSPLEDNFIKTTHCIIVFVAIDEDGNTRPVTKWQPQSEEEIAHEKHAIKLMQLRKNIDEEMKPFVYRNEIKKN